MTSRFYGIAGAVICLLGAALGAVRPAAAAVYTSPDASGAADTVYVAGDPDRFPLEYYSPEAHAYRGAIPDMLAAVSERTGISFTYIEASAENRQRELARNHQVELVSALESDRHECEVTELLPILEVELDERRVTYCIGFTAIASPELVQRLKDAFAELSDAEKTGFLLVNAQQTPASTRQHQWLRIGIIALAALLVAAGIATAVLARKAGHRDRDTLLDERTGVGNGKYYLYAFEQLLSRQSRNLYAVVCLALDGDTIRVKHGEKAPAEIEQYAAARLSAAMASSEYLARVDDGVFVLLIQALTEQECTEKMLEIVDSANRYVQEFYPETTEAFRAGAARLCDHPDCNAETAFYTAKQGCLAARRNGTPAELTDRSQLVQSRKQDRLRRSISGAVANGEFRIYLQLINANRSGAVCGAEVLSRWQNPEYGTLYPHEYIGLLKETGQIVEHDYKMFSAVCRQLEAWDTEPYDRLFLTCNFTRISLSCPDFYDRISRIAAGFHFDHSRLVIELTEDSISENSAVVSKNIRKCRATHFKIAIDDMGTGFTSFADLYDNEIDLVKIDGAFIAACTSARRRTMLEDIITLVHHSGAKVLCEGIERAEQTKFLDEMGCDMMQGFYFSKILPQAECARFLNPEKICAQPSFEE